MITVQQLTDLAEIQRLLDEAYDHYFANSDGHCKRNEGYVGLHFNTVHERRAGDPFEIVDVEVYSYVLGPHRTHNFPSTSAALEAVREWHRREMETDYTAGVSGW
jgi:hypothetical protein